MPDSWPKQSEVFRKPGLSTVGPPGRKGGTEGRKKGTKDGRTERRNRGRNRQPGSRTQATGDAPQRKEGRNCHGVAPPGLGVCQRSGRPKGKEGRKEDRKVGRTDHRNRRRNRQPGSRAQATGVVSNRGDPRQGRIPVAMRVLNVGVRLALTVFS